MENTPPWWAGLIIGPTVMAILTGFGWLFRFIFVKFAEISQHATNAAAESNKAFIDYLKLQADLTSTERNNREVIFTTQTAHSMSSWQLERDSWLQEMSEHTRISRQMYDVLKEIAQTLHIQNDINSKDVSSKE